MPDALLETARKLRLLVGDFEVRDASIYDPQGRPFLPVGVSLRLGSYDAPWWSEAGPARFTQEIVAVLRDEWRFNVLRLQMCSHERCQPRTNPFDDPAVDEQIELIASSGMVVWIDNKLVAAGREPQPADILRATRELVGIAERWKHHPYVWIQIWDEPGRDFSVDWLDWHLPVIRAIREVGFDNPIVVNGAHFGQDKPGDGNPYARSESAILTHGPQLAREYGPIIFDLHVYHRWAVPDPGEVARFLAEAHAADLTVVVGGVGWKRRPDARLAENDRIAGRAFYEQRTPGVGAVAWHGAADAMSLVSASSGRVWEYGDVSGLTEFGRYHWEFTHAPPPALARTPAGS